MKKTIFGFLLIIGHAGTVFSQAPPFARVHVAAPILATPDFRSVFGGSSGRTLKTDRCGQVRELEYIALPGTVFKILAEQKRGTTTVYQVETDEYPAPAGTNLYIDSRFVDLYDAVPPPRLRSLPPREQIVLALRRSAGSSYVWGGNIRDGVPELENWFYRAGGDQKNTHRTLAGLDCSGLLYSASGGWTPRNTSQLISYGRAVDVAEKQAGEIAALLEPLDLLVWKGHVVVVLDKQTAIESRLACGKAGNGGVRTTSLAKRLQEIMRTRRPANRWPTGLDSQGIFVVRRWYDAEK